ncbi:MAG: trigger factor [Clostridiales bacterium]|nr:trigger factor [Candidatus Crickella caballi]
MRAENRNRLFKYVAVICCALMLCGCKGSVDNLTVPDEYNYDDLSQYIKLGEYKGIEYEDAASQVSQSELQEAIDELLSESSEEVRNTTGTVKEDSKINIDYVGSIDGVEFEGGTGSDIDLDMADNNYIDGFADGILGHKAGTTFDINVTFPENYGNEELAGQPAVFKITVNYISEEDTPEYSDEWVKNNTDYDSMKDLEAGLKAEMLSEKNENSASDARTYVFDTIIDRSEVVEYPEKEYNSRYEQLVNSYKGYAEANDIEFSDYLEDQLGITEKEFESMAKETCETAVKQELVLHAIAQAEGIKPGDSDYQEFVNKLLTDSGYTEEDFEEQKGCTIKEYAELNNLYTSMLYQVVMDKVMEYSIAK